MLSSEQPITIAILAIGGQGGGVLSNWLRDLAEDNGWRAQTTSVPGVAQRTGATIYYIELLPDSAREPVMALMPIPGAVDLVVAAELMEAGRAMQRGLVTADRTTLIASSHREYAVAEKSVPGDGRADSTTVLEAAQAMAQRFIHADMAQLADAAGSVISASLFGAIAGSEVLPFSREAFTATIQKSGVGVASSLLAFDKGYDAVVRGVADEDGIVENTVGLKGGSDSEQVAYQTAQERIRNEFPVQTHFMLLAGLDAVVDFQDAAYGDEYLNRVAQLFERDKASEGAEHKFELTTVGAKYIARAMTYDDVIRVAGLKTRSARFARVRKEAEAGDEQLLQMTEFMHPRLEEICGTLPAGLGRAIERRPGLSRQVRRLTDHGRRVRTDTLFWFVSLYLLAGLRRWRRGSLRHQRETEHLAVWLQLVIDTVKDDYALAVEILKCRRLIKGYSDTHVRGTNKYDKVLSVLPLLAGRDDAANWISKLRQAALADEAGEELDNRLATVAELNVETSKQVA